MQGELVTIGLAVLAAGGQVVNIVLNLRIRNAILEQDKEQREDTDERLNKYVLTELCKQIHGETTRRIARVEESSRVGVRQATTDRTRNRLDLEREDHRLDDLEGTT